MRPPFHLHGADDSNKLLNRSKYNSFNSGTTNEGTQFSSDAEPLQTERKIEHKTVHPTTDDVALLCKRRGFVFQSGELYGGLSGFYDYGPLGVELKRNIKNLWWKRMVHEREDILGCDTSVITHPSTWVAAGHVDKFFDTYVVCNESEWRCKADKIWCGAVHTEDGEKLGYVTSLDEDEETRALSVEKQISELLKKQDKNITLQQICFKRFSDLSIDEQECIPSPITNHIGTLKAQYKQNLLFSTSLPTSLHSAEALEGRLYLRPETAQGIFTNYKTISDTHGRSAPFGVAQIGKVFRNEGSSGQFLYRMKEFEQMEIEYFIVPQKDPEFWRPYYFEWINASLHFLTSIGIPREQLEIKHHQPNDLAHYAEACVDINFRYPFGFAELMGIAYRGDFDLKKHQEYSGKSLAYFDRERSQRVFLHAIEPSFGVDRLVFATLMSAYTNDLVDGSPRTYLKLHPKIAPFKLGILPIARNNAPILLKARSIYKALRSYFNIYYDETGSIGKRYRRADEAGTPYCLTVDFDTLLDNSVTIRDRDTTKQIRIHLEKCKSFLDSHLDG